MTYGCCGPAKWMKKYEECYKRDIILWLPPFCALKNYDVKYLPMVMKSRP